ncbi:SDR family oxidoreductase [Schlegelella sp. S2-27]|uniref:SDR family oxidoreductase n=1 Tax=Caldimonas mangrovi TaxID=2944811 RepID=A0ABT0YLZ1_9BURK|nr:NAD(P)-binding oxidoreductase [Caldimonas mangrovi]MCM5679745.1 SDR family oxidoreductase [Caldimonas mangrovi]
MQTKQATTMKVLVIGASRGSGAAAVQALLAAGHEVTAFSRQSVASQGASPRLKAVAGDALQAGDLDRVMPGHDAVVVTLGISEDALRVRLRGPRDSPLDVRSRGTRQVIDAMRRHGVRRLVVQTSFGVGETRDKLPWLYRMMFALLLKPQIADTERQERAVRESGLDWVLAQPVNLTDGDEADAVLASAQGDVRGMKVARRQVARFLAQAVGDRAWLGRSVALSA